MAGVQDPEAQFGVSFPALKGARSTSALGRAVVSAALSESDPDGAELAGATENWRKRYAVSFRRLVESGLTSRAAAESIADDGLSEFHRQMVWVSADRNVAEVPLAEWVPRVDLGQGFSTELLKGDVRLLKGDVRRATEFGLPVRGRVLSGSALDSQLDDWLRAGVMEPSAAAAVRCVAAHPEWLSLPGRTVVCLGAGAELSPLEPLLAWGASVAAVDLPGEERWARLRALAGTSAGQLALPIRTLAEEQDGADLLIDLPALIDWIAALGPGLVLGNYTYADGGTNVALSAACDVLALRLRERRDDVTLAFLATPTDVFVAPPEAAQASLHAFASLSLISRTGRRLVGGLSRQRLLRSNYSNDPASLNGAQIHDALVLQQGPNYALAKRIQRWRATSESAAGRPVSLNVAPPTRTHSVLKNRALAAAYAGAGVFGVEVFEPATTRVLMAALLVHDLNVERPSWEHPWQAEADQAIHGGLWRTPYSPRSALGIAAVAGLARGGGGSRRRLRGDSGRRQRVPHR